MINLTTLYAGGADSDALPYGRGDGAPGSAAVRRPVVVWNATRRCSPACRDRDSNSRDRGCSIELTTDEARAFLADLAEFGIPALHMSGGEPFMRPDLFELLVYARGRGLRVTVSTDGTLITPARAAMLRNTGVAYVDVSLDGIGGTRDGCRGEPGAFDGARAGIRALRAQGVRAGLHLTLTHQTASQLDKIFQFAEREGVARVCLRATGSHGSSDPRRGISGSTEMHTARIPESGGNHVHRQARSPRKKPR